MSKINKENLEKCVDAVFEYIESDQMRAVTILYLHNATQFLSKKGISLGAMGIKELVVRGFDLPWEPKTVGVEE